MTKPTLKTQYDNEMGEIATILDRARDCAELSKPWLLPREGHNAEDEFKENYQSVGSNGLTVFVGKLMDLVFPVGRPFFRLDLSPEIRYAPNTDEDLMRERLNALFLRELTMMAVLETGSLERNQRRSRRTSFRTKKYQALMQCVGTGDVLEQLTDDYRMKVFRRDQWTCRRDSAGDVLHFILQEKVDIFTVKTSDKNNEQVRQEVGLDKIDEDADFDKRMHDMVTRCKYQPDTEKWLVEQEINDVVFNESEEPVSPFFSTPYELVSPEHHGRGLIENNLGDLSGLDKLELDLLNIMAAAGKNYPVVDSASEMRPSDLEQPSGTVLQGRVSGSQVQDVGMLTFDMAREYTILEAGINRKTQQLGGAMLTESEALPTGDRVTATQVVRVAREIELATGGVMASVSDDQQIPLLLRLEYQMERDKLITPIKARNTYSIVSITGINALRIGEKGQAALSLSQIYSQMPDQAHRKIDWGVLADILARYQFVNEPGLIKSNEEVAAEIAAERAAAVQQQAAEKAVDVVGNVAEQNATQPPEQQQVQ